MTTTTSRAACAAALLVLSFCVGPASSAGDPAKDIKDKDFKVRLAAIEAIEGSPGKDGEAALVEALKDKDWQVVERAAYALAKKGTASSVDELVNLAAQGPIRRIRVTAAISAGKIDETKAIEALGKKLNGEYVVHALEAVGEIAMSSQNETAAKIVDEALRPSKKHDKELEKIGFHDRDPVRKAAASSLTAFPTAGRVARVEKLMFDPDIGVACAALDTVVEVPDAAFLPVMIKGLSVVKIDDCVERRLRNGIRAIVVTKPSGAEALAIADPVLKAVGAAPNPEGCARLTRIVGDLGKAPPVVDKDALSEKEKAEADKAKPPESIIPGDKAVEALGPALTHADAKVRAAAAAAMGKIRTEGALAQAISLAGQDQDARVRLIAMRALASSLTAKDERAFKVFVERLSDADALVREEAAVALGVKGVAGAVPSLTKMAEEAIADKKGTKWALGTVALVSLGKTQDETAVEPLRKALHDASDWRLRASAVVGLGRVQRNSAVNDLIDALDDKDLSVKNCAYEFLRRMSSKDIEADAKAWRAWWKTNEAGYQFMDREEEFKKARKYGYAPTIEGLYQGMDVVVLATRGGGDRIEDLLDVMKIVHRLCRQPKVTDAGLHPFALFFANCPGEIGANDVDALSWYVRSGGYLFSSCWALHETVEKIYPGMVKRYETPGAQVIDYNVKASPCVPDSVYLDGVFDPWTRPMYVLEGAHLIEVMDKDRVETLIDSPDSATSWGSGNLACWFTAGHGVILDSVNHFNHQGFHFATGLKTAEDRAAYAMDHMGITYADMREFAAKKIFDNSGKCAAEVTDESAFRFISNFVRYKRRIDL